jgi:acid phosphatase
LFYTHRAQINEGKNDRFVAFKDVLGWTDPGGLTMGYYGQDAMSHTYLWKLARRYTLLDNFFQGAFGGSFLNHFWLICACAPEWTDPPKPDPNGDNIYSKLDGRDPARRGDLQIKGDRIIIDRHEPNAPDGNYAVNTVQSVLLNSDPKGTKYLPSQDKETIGDVLIRKLEPTKDSRPSWAWYSGGWNLAKMQFNNPFAMSDSDKAELTRLDFQYHHQPFAYFDRFNPKDGLTPHLKDRSDLIAAIKGRSLPPVAFYKPAGLENEHPNYSDIKEGDDEVCTIVETMKKYYKGNYLIVITFDEFGGFYDHVAPPSDKTNGQADFFGPGSRVPAILVSPYAKRKPGDNVDSNVFETTSILKLIQERYELDDLPSPRFKSKAVVSLSKALDFTLPDTDDEVIDKKCRRAAP